MTKSIIRTSSWLLAYVVFVLAGTPGSAEEIKEPELSNSLKSGKFLYTLKCSACHGDKTQGTDRGPTFQSRIYHPNHHGDEAFFRAARDGARAHHWKFGDMPPVENITDEQIASIVAYIRAVQQANDVY